ncbi:MAG: TonB-dependent receptor [Acidobacteria bacterium]|nr:TonB-dependent receptor [Acidobacteriota bacterium]
MQTKAFPKLAVYLFVLAMIAAGSSRPAVGQATGGTLRGTVKDSTGAVVPEAVVTATNEATGAKFVTVTSSAGLYSFPNLLVGSYSVSVEHTGFKKTVRKDVAVSANQITDADTVLEIGEVSTTIEVVGGAELLSLTTSQLGATIEEKTVRDIPNAVLGGSPLNLAVLLPNTTTQAGGVLGEGGSIGGNRPRNNNFTIDGVDNNDVALTGSLQPVIQDAVAEFNLISNQFSAEYGHSTAGQFNIITKSGTNEYHGSAFYYGQNRHLNAMDNLTKAALKSGDIDKKPRFDYARLGGTFGGPIMKDKLFFFGAYEYRTRGEAATGVTVLSPTAEGMSALNSLAANTAVTNILQQFPTASSASDSIVVSGQTIPIGDVQFFAPDFENQHDFQINIDYNVGKHQLRGRFLYDRLRQPNLNPSLPLTQFTGDLARDGRKVALTDIWAITSRLANDFRLSYSRNFLGYSVPGTFVNFPTVKIDELGLNIGPEENSPQSTTQNSYQVLNNLSYVLGRHQIKGGIEYRNIITPGDFLPRGRGEWDYSTLSEFINDLVPNGYNGALRGAGSGFFAGNQHSLYWFFQDDVKVAKNLTLNLGLRYEYTTNPRDANLQTLNSVASLPGVFEFGKPKTDKNNFGPRFGFAYSPDFTDGFLKKVFGSSGRSSIRGGFAIAYDVNFQNLVSLQLPPQLQTEQNPTITCASATPPSWCATGAGFLAGGGLLQVNVPPVTQEDARASTGSLIVDQVAPKTYTWTLSLQRELAGNYVLELRYLGTRGLSLPLQARLNAITVFERHPELALPTYFANSAVPAGMPLTAPSLEDFYLAQDLRYSADGFLGLVTAFPAVGNSIYHAGSAELRRRFSKGLFMLANYTWSRTIDDSTNELYSSLVNARRPQDPYNLRNERGLSALDMPHKFSLSWTYELPLFFHRNGLAGRFLDGWQFNGTYLAQSGQPITALSGQDANGDFDAAGDRALYNPNGSGMTGTRVNYVLRNPDTGATSIVSEIDEYGSQDSRVVGYVAANPNARFVVAMPGTPDDGKRVGRNTIRTLGLNNWNLSVFKGFKFDESRELQLRAEFFNAFNHRQYSLGLPSYEQSLDNALSGTYAYVSALQFLDASQFSGGSRTVQMSLKFIF